MQSQRAHNRLARLDRRTRQRGATMVSVMLLTISLMTVALLVVKTSSRELTETNAHVARERALMASHAAVDLAVAQIRADIQAGGTQDPVDTLNLLLPGQASSKDCSAKPTSGDCIPGQGSTATLTGMRYEALNNLSDCSGQPCMRPGAVVELDIPGGATQRWVDLPLRTLLPGADPEATVTVWIRNNSIDALDTNGTGDWTIDGDGRAVLTAAATVRHTTVVIEKEISFGGGTGPQPLQQSSPDLGYGGGHNNDNASVQTCATQSGAGVAGTTP